MQGSQTRGEGAPFFRILEGHASPQMLSQPEAMSDMNQEISKEMAGREAKRFEDLRNVGPVPKSELSVNPFDCHFPLSLSYPQ
jgi:hypothetical protein